MQGVYNAAAATFVALIVSFIAALVTALRTGGLPRKQSLIFVLAVSAGLALIIADWRLRPLSTAYYFFTSTAFMAICCATGALPVILVLGLVRLIRRVKRPTLPPA